MRIRQSVELDSSADEVVTFSRPAAKQHLTIFGENGCATQTVTWTPMGPMVLNFQQFPILSALPHERQPVAGGAH